MRLGVFMGPKFGPINTFNPLFRAYGSTECTHMHTTASIFATKKAIPRGGIAGYNLSLILRKSMSSDRTKDCGR